VYAKRQMDLTADRALACVGLVAVDPGSMRGAWPLNRLIGNL